MKHKSKVVLLGLFQKGGDSDTCSILCSKVEELDLLQSLIAEEGGGTQKLSPSFPSTSGGDLL